MRYILLGVEDEKFDQFMQLASQWLEGVAAAMLMVGGTYNAAYGDEAEITKQLRIESNLAKLESLIPKKD